MYCHAIKTRRQKLICFVSLELWRDIKDFNVAQIEPYNKYCHTLKSEYVQCDGYVTLGTVYKPSKVS